MPNFSLHRPSDDLVPWSQAGYVIMVGLAVVVIAARSDMNPKLRNFLRTVPMIGEMIRPGDQPPLRHRARPGALHPHARGRPSTSGPTAVPGTTAGSTAAEARRSV